MKQTFNQANKHNILRWVTDFTDPQDHIRNTNNVRKLSTWDWLWCHPSAYKLFKYSSPIVSSVLFFSIGVYSIFRNWNLIATIIFMLLSVVYALCVFKVHKDIKKIPNLTFYDIHLREYK